MNQDRQLMGFVAIALAAVLTVYLTSMPAKKTQQDSNIGIEASDIFDIEPAAGDIVPGGVGSASGSEESAIDEKVYSVVQIFATEEECRQTTSTACHFVKCEDAPAVGTEEEEEAIENACEANQKSGWRPVVPAPDKTAIPDVVAPPLPVGQQEAPAE